jgi:uncharacterized protein YbjQ (UPF0145 family)
MEQYFGLIAGLVFVLFMLGLGFFVGGATERAHFNRLDRREAEQSDFFVTQLKTFPGIASDGPPPQAFFGEAIIASDYLKNFIGGLRKFFGGEMGSYQKLLERARREALLRIIEEARASGYNAMCNVRFESADIGGNNTTAGNKAAVMAPIMVAGTAYLRAQ